MKKKKNIKKEIPKVKLKKAKNSILGIQINNPEAQNLLKVINHKFKPIVKAYDVFKEKRKIKKLKEERRRQKEDDAQKLIEQENKKIQEQEERKLQKEKKIRLEQAKKLKD